MAIAAFAAVAFALVLPLFLAEEPADLILRGSSVRAADQNAFTLSEPIEIMAEPRVVVTRGTVSLAQPQGSAPLSSTAIIELLSSGKSVLILTDAELFVGSKDQEDSISHVDAPFAKALAQADYRALIIERGRLTIGAEKSTVLEDVELRLRRVAGERLVAKGNFELLGRKLDFETTIGARDGHFDAKQLPVRGTVSAGTLLNASFSGLFALGDGGRLIADKSHLTISDVPVFARWAGLSWPSDLGLKSFVADGQFEWVRQVINFQSGRFQLDGNVATGSLLVNGKGERPLIDGTLAFARLDLGAHFAVQSKTSSLFAKTVRGTTDWLPESLRGMLKDASLPILRQVDVDLRVSAQQAVTPNFTVNKAAAALSLRDGRILLDLAELELPRGGHGSLLVSIDPNSGITKTGLRGKLMGVRIEDVSDIVLPRQVLLGPADVSIDVTGDGESPEAFLRSLDGKLSMKMGDGAMLNADLPALVTSIGVNEPPVEGWGAATRGQSAVESLSAEISFERGKARIDRLVTQRQGLCELAMTGTVNFHGRSVDLNLFARIESDSGSGADGGVPSVVNINGGWERPSVFKRPFPNKAENPVYPEKHKEGSSGEKTEASTPSRG
ncbi:MAG: AsmA family protein [Alphaproteobacteria bacterium]|nr:AsmA family protein [Alphaproteobacteria bacterium]